MDAMESMVGDLDTWIPDTWWGTHTWLGAHIHGVEPTYMVAKPGGQPDFQRRASAAPGNLKPSINVLTHRRCIIEPN